MSDQFYFIEEPLLSFGEMQNTEDPRDGLGLFGPSEPAGNLTNVAIGTKNGLDLWNQWIGAMNTSSACVDVSRHRPWPPFPGFEAAFGAVWPKPTKSYQIDQFELEESAFKSDRYERAYSVANHYLKPIEQQVPRLDGKPALAVCIVPDHVHKNCRPKSFVADPSDEKKTNDQKQALAKVLKDRRTGQGQLFGLEEIYAGDAPNELQQYGLSPDFRRQLKARVMPHEIPVQIVRESTLAISSQVREGQPGTNPLSDRLWNLGTALFYKCGRKPWKTPWAREGVCYIGLAYRRDERDNRTACCAAQMFLDSGDGIVFVGDFGPWYSEERREFHLSPDAAERLLRGTIETYTQQDGRPLKEIFLHARSGIDAKEYEAFKKACPPGVDLIAIRVQQDRLGPRLFRHDNHFEPSKRGRHPVLRGTFWKRTARYGLLFTNGFKPRIGTYDGWEIPVPLSIHVQHGDADLLQVARDILGLTKLNYNSCQLGEGQPITVKYSDRIGEILLANPEMSGARWQHNFKYYI